MERPPDPTVEPEAPPDRTFEAISGLDAVTDRLSEAVVTPVTDERLEAFGASGVLIHGPPGVGKTHVAESLLGELDFEYLEVTPADITLDRPDEAAATIDELLDAVFANEPCALLIDDIDVLAPAGDDDRSEQVVTELCNVLDELDETTDREVLFVGTTTELSQIDDRVRRAGRVDLTLAIESPDFNRRCAILRDELVPADVTLPEEDLERLAGWTDGFSAAELGEVVDRAVRKAAGEAVEAKHFVEAVDELHDLDDFLNPDAVTDTDDETADDDAGFDFSQFTPDPQMDDGGGVTGRGENRGEIIEDEAVPDVSFADVGGLDATEQRLREVVEWPRKYPERFARMDVDTAKGILLHGPPGTGKTLLAKAIANETDSTFISVDGPELLDRYVGESERFVRQLFEAAQEKAPSVVFIDEIDSIGGNRGGYTGGGGVQDSIVNQFLSELDGLTSLEDVVVIGATNRIEVIDPALRRPGRLGEAIHVPPPDDEGRREVFEIHSGARRLADDVDVDWLVERTDAAYTGADVEEICERAAMNAIRDSVDDGTDDCSITRHHFEQAIESVTPSGGLDGGSGADPAFR